MKPKQRIITFKVDEALHDEIKNIPNRSEFIRRALLEALGSVCPLCKGSGMLTANQKRHWDEFAIDHVVKTCQECHESFLVCSNAQ